MARNPITSLREYVAKRISVEDRGFDSPCWVWKLRLTEKGYARTKLKTRGRFRVHRATYEEYVGPIPDGLEIDHLCRVTACCNPAHLEPVTNKENAKRRSMAELRNRSHCLHGHPLTPETYVITGRKRPRHHCRICAAIRTKKYTASRRRKEAMEG